MTNVQAGEILCSRCGETKKASQFYDDRHAKNGKKSWCKKCILEKRKEKNGNGEPARKRRKIDGVEHHPVRTVHTPGSNSNVQLSSKPPSEEAAAEDEYMVDNNYGLPEGADRLDIRKANLRKEYLQFQLSDHCKPHEMFSMAMIGSRGSGKTTIIYNMCDEWEEKFDLIIVFSNSIQAETYKFLEERDKFILLPDYDGEVIRYFEMFQRRTKNGISVLFLFDDCSSLRNVKYSDELLQLFIRGRNMRASVIVSTQSPMLINKDSRQNTDYMLLLKLRTEDMKENVVNHYIRGHVPLPDAIDKKSHRYDFYYKWIADNTKDHECRVFNFKDDKIYSYKCAETIPNVQSM